MTWQLIVQIVALAITLIALAVTIYYTRKGEKYNQYVLDLQTGLTDSPAIRWYKKQRGIQ